MLLHYQNRVQLERREREGGDEFAADFYLRQLTYFEIVLECGGAGLDLIEVALGKKHHKRQWDWAEADVLATTPLSEGLAVARFNGWIRHMEGKDILNQSEHAKELREMAGRFDEVFEEDEEED